MQQPTILVTGALGQIGRVLLERLVRDHGAPAVLATDLADHVIGLPCRYVQLDATDEEAWRRLADRFTFERVYHLVAVLSAKGEANPWQAWDINMQSWRSALTTAQAWPGCRVFYPSSIAVYGPPLPTCATENTALWPTTSYGISKAAGEQWGDYARRRYGVDVRSLRLPGVIGYQTLPGGGTTDYAVDIFHQALRRGRFTCFLSADTRLPMIYMDDVLRGIEDLMSADAADLAAAGAHAVYNLAGFSVSPRELADAIRAELPAFEIEYAPDERQRIAESWPEELDGRLAERAFGWRPRYDLAATTCEMLTRLRAARPA